MTRMLTVVAVAGLLLSGCSSGDDEPSAEDLRYGAFDVCQEFVKARLKAPGTAKFRNYFEDDGEVVVTGSGQGPYTVRSSVDSENSFGASLRSNFTCTVRNVEGERWRLVDVVIDEAGR